MTIAAGQLARAADVLAALAAATPAASGGLIGGTVTAGGGTPIALGNNLAIVAGTLDLAATAADRILGNATGGSAIPTALTGAQAASIIGNFSSGSAGVVPASGGGTTNYLRADATFANPVANRAIGPGASIANELAIFAGTDGLTLAVSSVKASSGQLTQSQSGQFSQSLGAFVHRLADRVFVGDAVQNAGDSSSTGSDWLETLISGTTSIAQFASLGTIGTMGILGATRSSTAPNTVLDNFGVTAIGVNDNISGQHNVVTTLYSETHHFSGAFQSIAQESDIIPYSGTSVGDCDPYAMSTNLMTANQWLSCGKPGVTGADATVAIGILNNSNKYKRGIVLGSNALLTDSAIGNLSSAISLAAGHALVWYSAAATPSGAITFGTGAPSLTLPKGSVFMRTDGSAGSTMYVTQGGGTWNAVAGV